MKSPLKIFIIYARRDRRFKDDLLKSLKMLQNKGLIDPWHDNDIKPGEEYDKEIIAHLQAADIILPIISFDFFNSDYINKIEIKEAFERYHRGEVTIIPIIADTCPWWDSPDLKGLQVLPEDAKPIIEWTVRSKSMTSIYEGVKRIILELKDSSGLPKIGLERKQKKNTRPKPPTVNVDRKSEPFDKAREERKKRDASRLFTQAEKAVDWHEKIEYYSKAIELNNEYDEAYCNRGFANMQLQRYEAALADFDEAIIINPNYSPAFLQRGWVKFLIAHHQESILDFDHAIRLGPPSAMAFYKRGLVKLKMELFLESIEDFNSAIRFNLNDSNVLINRGIAKERLELWNDAQLDYQTVLATDPENETAKRHLKNLETKVGNHN